MPSKKSKTEDLPDEPPSSIDPYAVLDLDKSATAEHIKTAYRKAALKWHPDKAQPADKDTAHKKFQEVAFAYAILSDDRRRARYDTTGRTAESLDLDDDDDFNWSDFFRTQFAEVVSSAAILKFKSEYQGSEEERLAVLEAYKAGKGDMDRVYEEVMLSSPLEDEERFGGVIDAAIEKGEVKAFKKYTAETEKERKRRVRKAREEEGEAMELARELGIEEKLFGDSGKGSAKKSKGDDESALKALIQQRQKGREESFLANLEAKYAPKAKKGRKRAQMEDEPPEEAFQKTAERAKKAKSRKN